MRVLFTILLALLSPCQGYEDKRAKELRRRLEGCTKLELWEVRSPSPFDAPEKALFTLTGAPEIRELLQSLSFEAESPGPCACMGDYKVAFFQIASFWPRSDITTAILSAGTANTGAGTPSSPPAPLKHGEPGSRNRANRDSRMPTKPGSRLKRDTRPIETPSSTPSRILYAKLLVTMIRPLKNTTTLTR